MKRVFDFTCALSLLFVLSPMICLAMIAVRLKMGSPVFFRQQRPGKDGKPFEMIKLRSMLGTVDSRGEPLPDEKLLTRLGKFLRSTSIDEFPALWNVIKGEMSLVGPRPLLMEYLPLYNERQNRRHDVKPGIIGWPQVNGRNAISWEDKFELDVWYGENRSLLLDLKILFFTFGKVFRRDGTPRADVEAMSMGRPVITTDAPGCRETVRNGKNGFLVPVKFPVDLADAVIRRARSHNLRNEMGRVSREIAVENSDVHKVNQSIIKHVSAAIPKAC